ncbi:MAG: proline racemase family protein [Mogibacterium sp.]|nr:proline racemase family protein [Mogibacterium sp.]
MVLSSLDYIDYHVSCEPFRLLTEPMTDLRGDTQREVREDFRKRYDAIRRRVLREPRGHSDQYGGILTPAIHADSLFGVLFLYSTGMSSLCGHGAIAIARAAVDLGYLERREGYQSFRFDAPVGQVRAFVEIENGEVVRSGFDNIESFFIAENVPITVPGYGRIGMTVGYGGAFMAFVNEQSLGIDILEEPLEDLIRAGMACKDAFLAQTNFIHPVSGLQSAREGICLLIEKDPVTRGDTVLHRNFTVFGNHQYDRSPTGTGSSALAAILCRRGILKPGMRLENRGRADIPFHVEIKPVTGGIAEDSVIPTVSGRAYMIARGTSLLEAGDPLPEGYSERQDES